MTTTTTQGAPASEADILRAALDRIIKLTDPEEDRVFEDNAGRLESVYLEARNALAEAGHDKILENEPIKDAPEYEAHSESIWWIQTPTDNFVSKKGQTWQGRPEAREYVPAEIFRDAVRLLEDLLEACEKLGISGGSIPETKALLSGARPETDKGDATPSSRKNAEPWISRYEALRQWFIDGRPRHDVAPYGHIMFTTPEIIDQWCDEQAASVSPVKNESSE